MRSYFRAEQIMKITGSYGTNVVFRGITTSGIDISCMTNTTIVNCTFIEGGNVTGDGIFNLIANNNHQYNISYEDFFERRFSQRSRSQNKHLSNISGWCNGDYLQGFLRYSLLYLNSKAYNPYGD